MSRGSFYGTSAITRTALPGTGALAVMVWIGAHALIFGALLVALTLRLRSFQSQQGPRAANGVA